MKKKSLIIIGFIALLLIGAVISFLFYQSIYNDNINDSQKVYELYILPNNSYEDVKQELLDKNILKDSKSFDLVAKLMSYNKEVVPSGKYSIPNDLSNRDLISMLRAGRQSPVNLTINNVRTLEELAGKLSKNILADSIDILETLINQDVQQQYGHTAETLISLFIPNTYKVYWNISPEALLKRMSVENEKFWNQDRNDKISNIGLTKTEVYTLASIVDKESLVKDEKPRIAGVYMNRLKNNIPLQADPTVVFALKQFDLRRVLNKHLEYDSPYNTYLYAGLPPGPIAMSSISGIDAVLNYETHEFLYFCAKPDGNGQHAFAKTLKGHNKNAQAYWRWLNSRGIR